MPIVEFSTGEGRHLLVNAHTLGTSVLVDDALALNYDREGRLTGAWMNGRNYLRTLDNRIIEKQEGPQPGLSYRLRRELDNSEARALLAQVYDRTIGYRDAVRDPATRILNGASEADRETVLSALDQVVACDLERLERDRVAFRRTYKPINILPPDQYLSLVLQATEGCSYNQCAFCGFYRDRSFRIKRLDEFQRHLSDVRALFGQAINLRKGIFLADANALVIPQEQLLPLFDVVRQEFAFEPRDLERPAREAWRAEHPVRFSGVYSFVDAFTTRRKSAADFAALAARGLRRVYIGLESGDAELLKFLGKPNSPQDVFHLVRQVKAGGVAVGLVILAGAGGEQYSERHVRNTVELLNALPLDGEDLVYFSELVDYAGSSYSALARSAGIRPLSIPEIEQQVAQMRTGFHFDQGALAPRISYYDVREFVY